MDNQNKIGMFLVAIVAVVAVVGIVLQFSGSSSGLDVSATGQAVNARFNVDSAKVLDGAPKLVAKSQDTESEGFDVDSYASVDWGASSITTDFGGLSEQELAELERAREGCAACAADATNNLLRCEEQAISAAVTCGQNQAIADSGSSSEDPAQVEDFSEDCDATYELAMAQCRIFFFQEVNHCQRDFSYKEHFQCVVDTSVATI